MSTTIQPNSIEAACRMYEALTGQRHRVTDRLEEVLGALKSGLKDVLVEVDWGEQRRGELHDRHQVILQRVAGGRVYFINALKNPGAVGDSLGGPDKGPVRRVEEHGEESMDEPAFVALFAQGGKGMLPVS